MKNELQIPTPSLQKYLEKFLLISTLLYQILYQF